MNPSQPLHGLVLAGGRSSRMGTDKAALVHPDGRPLARRAHDLLVEAGCGQVMLSLRHDQPVPAGFADLTDVAVVRDPEGGSAGPLVGIIAAMALQPDADWLVLACDLPRLDVETLNHLVSSKRPAEMFLSYRSEFDGLPEPLCALYAPAALPLLRDTEFRCPRKVLILHECRLLEPVTPRALDNANTPEDWQSANRP
jgi:molybdopterin-guanine dinucleotide biosynthesis protein A